MAILLQTDFSEETLNSHITINQTSSMHPMMDWCSTYSGTAGLDTNNQRLRLAEANHWFGGDCRISGLSLTTAGFNASFDVGGNFTIFSFIFNYIDENNLWYFQYYHGDPHYQIYKIVDGVTTSVASVPYNGTTAGNYELSLTIDGKFSATIQGNPIFDNVDMGGSLTENDIYIQMANWDSAEEGYLDNLIVETNSAQVKTNLKSTVTILDRPSVSLKSTVLLLPAPETVPVSSFTVTVDGHTVTCKDTSTNSPTDWLWYFDSDGIIGQEKEVVWSFSDYWFNGDTVKTAKIVLVAINEHGKSNIFFVNVIVTAQGFHLSDANNNKISNINFPTVYDGKISTSQEIKFNTPVLDLMNVEVSSVVLEDNPVSLNNPDSVNYLELSLNNGTWYHGESIGIEEIDVNDSLSFYVRANIPNNAPEGNWLCGLKVAGTYKKYICPHPEWSKIATMIITGSTPSQLNDYTIPIRIDHESWMQSDMKDIRFIPMLENVFCQTKLVEVVPNDHIDFLVRIQQYEFNEPYPVTLYILSGNPNAIYQTDSDLVESSSETPPTIGTMDNWVDNRIDGDHGEITIIASGNVFSDDPTKPPSNIGEEIIFQVEGLELKGLTGFSTEIRGNDAASTFNANIITKEDLKIFTGQYIYIKEAKGNRAGFYQGELQDIDDTKTRDQRTYVLSGRNPGSPLITQPFVLNAQFDPNTVPVRVAGIEDPPVMWMKTSEEVLQMILQNTGVIMGACCDFDLGMNPLSDFTNPTFILNQNDQWNGFAGNWNTKADALNDFFLLISKLKNKNISWFVDRNGLFRIFETDVVDPNIGITISKNSPRVLSISIKEGAENIINDQSGISDINATLNQLGQVIHVQDMASIGGWVDSYTKLRWPGYGNRTGVMLHDSKAQSNQELTQMCQAVLDLHSMPIFTAKIVFSRFPQFEIGQPLYIKDHYKVDGKTFIVTGISQNGADTDLRTTVEATTDKRNTAILSDYETIKAIAIDEVKKAAPFWGIAKNVGQNVVNVQPVNKSAKVNCKNLTQGI